MGESDPEGMGGVHFDRTTFVGWLVDKETLFVVLVIVLNAKAPSGARSSVRQSWRRRALEKRTQLPHENVGT